MFKTCFLAIGSFDVFKSRALKALDITINSLGSGSVVVKKGKKTGSILFSLFPQGGAWSKAKPLTTVTSFSFLLIVILGEHIRTKKKAYFDLSSGHLETAS